MDEFISGLARALGVTEILLNEQPVTLDQLQAGDRAHVRYDIDRDRIEIHATRQT